jgi:type IV pilus assembly protein PilY1
MNFNLYSHRSVTLLLWGATCWANAQNAGVQPPAVPPNLQQKSLNPMVMLAASRDWTMFTKAYTDYTDMNGDNQVDRTFLPNFKYAGYFDPAKCYQYDLGDGRFEPQSWVTSPGADGRLYCPVGSGLWSGNFLNWATMSRIDILRGALYGGLRSNDPVSAASSTVLELSFIPRNSWAIVKYYNGTDLNRLTPFSTARGITLCRRPSQTSASLSQQGGFTPVIRVAEGNVLLWNMTEVTTCNWSNEVDANGNPIPSYSWKTATIQHLNNNYVTPAGTLGASNAQAVHLATIPALTGAINRQLVARVEVCKNNLLESNCTAYGKPTTGLTHKPTGVLQNVGTSPKSGYAPAPVEFGLMLGSYDRNKDGGRLRKVMSEINDEIDPNTGAFIAPTKSSRGGIIDSFNKITSFDYRLSDGFISITSDGESGTGNCDLSIAFSSDFINGQCPMWGNPIGELVRDAVRYFAGDLNSSEVDNGPNDDQIQGGLPVPKLSGNALDPLKYSPVINNGLSRREIYGPHTCRPMYTLALSSGVSSYDADQMGSFQQITAFDITSNTQRIGNTEGINGTVRLVGNNGDGNANNQCTGKYVSDLSRVLGICPEAPNFQGSYLGAGLAATANMKRIRNELASPNNPPDPSRLFRVRNLSVSLNGGSASIPVQIGSRTVLITPASLDTLDNKFLPGNLVDMKIISQTPTSGSALVLWQHNRLGDDQDQDMLGALTWQISNNTITVSTQTLEADTASSREFGFGYTIVGTTADGLYLTSGINNFVIDAAQVGTLNFGGATWVPVVANPFITPYIRNSSNQYEWPNPGTGIPNAGQGCRVINPNYATGFQGNVGSAERLCSVYYGNYYRGTIGKTFTVSGASNASLRDPLWYMAKYGGFNFNESTQTWPTSSRSWDTRNSNFQRCNPNSNTPCDGEPDNYFLARNPSQLAGALGALLSINQLTTNTAAATTSQSVSSGSRAFIAKYFSDTGAGELEAIRFNLDGTLQPNASWRANQQLEALSRPTDQRQIITNNAAVGVAFRWSNLGTSKQSILRGPDGTPQEGIDLLNWFRGATPTATQALRPRFYQTNDNDPTTFSSALMGSIVNSNPTVQTVPAATYSENSSIAVAPTLKPFKGYAAFKTQHLTRRPTVWVGAGDGMLHGFDTELGTPRLSYVPELIFANLPDWAQLDKPPLQAFVDGSPFVADVNLNSNQTSGSPNWRTYLFSTLGRGGRGLFALDVTQAGQSSGNLNEANAAGIFKWQYPASGSIDNDMGYIISEIGTNRSSNQPAPVAPLNNGQFALLLGNSVNSPDGRAVLYIIGMDGELIRKITADAPVAKNNGLSAPTWIDINRDGTADFIYAGDIRGNLWKFDVSSSDPTKWQVAYSGRPLFIALDADVNGNRLPISSSPLVYPHLNGGLMVAISTGLSINNGDFPITNAGNSGAPRHGMFALWDRAEYSKLPPAQIGSQLPIPITRLKPRTLQPATSSVAGDLQVVGDPMNWLDANPDLGWKLPFYEGSRSEMSLTNPIYAFKSLLVLTTMAPNYNANANDCSPPPGNRVTVINALDGRVSVANNLGSTTSSFLVNISRGNAVAFGTDPRQEFKKLASSDANSDRLKLQNLRSITRQSWREIPGLKIKGN